GRVDRGVSERIIAQTGGNPLGLIELGGELSREQLAGEVSLPELLPAGGSLQARYLRQISSMPAETQVLLLAAAADPTGDPALLWRAGELQPEPPEPPGRRRNSRRGARRCRPPAPRQVRPLGAPRGKYRRCRHAGRDTPAQPAGYWARPRAHA